MKGTLVRKLYLPEHSDKIHQQRVALNGPSYDELLVPELRSYKANEMLDTMW